jgi:hypothetical protein
MRSTGRTCPSMDGSPLQDEAGERADPWQTSISVKPVCYRVILIVVAHLERVQRYRAIGQTIIYSQDRTDPPVRYYWVEEHHHPRGLGLRRQGGTVESPQNRTMPERSGHSLNSPFLTQSPTYAERYGAATALVDFRARLRRRLLRQRRWSVRWLIPITRRRWSVGSESRAKGQAGAGDGLLNATSSAEWC